MVYVGGLAAKLSVGSVTLQIGPHSFTIPAGSFRPLPNGQQTRGSWFFFGVVDRAFLFIRIEALGRGGRLAGGLQQIDLPGHSDDRYWGQQGRHPGALLAGTFADPPHLAQMKYRRMDLGAIRRSTSRHAFTTQRH